MFKRPGKILLNEPCCCIKVWLNQMHTTIKRRFPLLCRRPRGPHGPEGLYFSKVTIWVIQWITLIYGCASMVKGLIHPVRNSSPAIAGLETERGIISNGVNSSAEFNATTG